MIKVWFLRDGPEPTDGSPRYELLLNSCINSLGLERQQWFADKVQKVRFNVEVSADLARIAGYKHVVCQIDASEAETTGWKEGFYRINLEPGEVAGRLGPPRHPWVDI